MGATTYDDRRFQLTASQGGWLLEFPGILYRGHFNSQPHKEADLMRQMSRQVKLVFQLTASQGGWLIMLSGIIHQKNFNSQPHKEADGELLEDILAELSISTHSLTRRLTGLFLYKEENHGISTHSLTRRLTEPELINDAQPDISTHSLTRRLTRASDC